MKKKNFENVGHAVRRRQCDIRAHNIFICCGGKREGISIPGRFVVTRVVGRGEGGMIFHALYMGENEMRASLVLLLLLRRRRRGRD